MSVHSAPQPQFPCPFCRSSSVVCIGEGTFTHYRCTDCAETWSVLAFPRRKRPDAASLPRTQSGGETIH